MNILGSTEAINNPSCYKKPENIAETLATQRNTNDSSPEVQVNADSVHLTQSTKDSYISRTSSTENASTCNDPVFKISEADQRKIEMIERYIKQLTGKEYKIHIPQKVVLKNEKDEVIMTINTEDPQRVGWGIIYHKKTDSFEPQDTATFATADIQADNGSIITATLSLSIEKTSVGAPNIAVNTGKEEQNSSLMNDYSPATAIPDKLSFAYDFKGKTEVITFTGTNNALSALNENGKTQQRNIGENDDVLSGLKIWVKNADGNTTLFAIHGKEADGIFLGNTIAALSTSYTLNVNSQQRDEESISGTKPTIKSIQHIDLLA